MSDTSGADWLTGDDSDQPTATGTIIGTDIEIEVVDVTQDDLDELAGAVEDGEPDMEAKHDAIREYLVAVEGDDPPDPEEMLLRRKNVLWMSMSRVWSGAEDIRPAMEELQLPGNGR